MISNCFVYLLCLPVELGCLGSHPVADDAACLTELPSRPGPHTSSESLLINYFLFPPPKKDPSLPMKSASSSTSPDSK